MPCRIACRLRSPTITVAQGQGGETTPNSPLPDESDADHHDEEDDDDECEVYVNLTDVVQAHGSRSRRLKSAAAWGRMKRAAVRGKKRKAEQRLRLTSKVLMNRISVASV